MSAHSSARVAERPLQLGDLAVERVDRVAHPQLEVDRHLVVARARGVQPARRGADELGEPALDIHVNVLERARKGEGSRLDFALDLVRDRRRWRRRRPGRRRPGAASIATWACEPAMSCVGQLAVEVDGGVDLLHDLRRAAGETPAPHCVAHDGKALDRTMSENDKRSRRMATVGRRRRAGRPRGGRGAIRDEAPAPGKAEADCPASSALAAPRLAPLAHGDIAALAVDGRPSPRSRSPSTARTAAS